MFLSLVLLDALPNIYARHHTRNNNTQYLILPLELIVSASFSILNKSNQKCLKTVISGEEIVDGYFFFLFGFYVICNMLSAMIYITFWKYIKIKTSSFWKQGIIHEKHFLVKEGNKEFSKMKSNLDVIRSSALIFHIEKKSITVTLNAF